MLVSAGGDVGSGASTRAVQTAAAAAAQSRSRRRRLKAGTGKRPAHAESRRSRRRWRVTARGDLAAVETYGGINGALGRMRDLSAAAAGASGPGPAITMPAVTWQAAVTTARTNRTVESFSISRAILCSPLRAGTAISDLWRRGGEDTHLTSI